MGFTIIDNVAYTEDNVLVYNIMVFNISKRIADRRIWKHFERFGSVWDIRILPYPQTRHKCMGVLVYYNHPRSAANALRTSHRLDRRHLRVLAARTWHQPGGRNPWSLCTSTSDELSILKLNDYCIAKVFSYLPADDQINLARTDPRLRALFSFNAQQQYKELRLKTINVLSVWETFLFFQMAGRFVQKITGAAPPTEILKFIGIHCPNLHYLRFAEDELFDWPCHMTRYGINLLLRNTSLLRHLELDNASLQDNSVSLLPRIENLKVLSLANNSELTGKYLASLKRLEILTLSNCSQLSSQYFTKLCKEATSLKSLAIESCSLLTACDVKVMADNLCNLETLKLSADIVDVKSLANLKNLKNLHLISTGRVATSVISDLVVYLGQQLELFELKGVCYNTQVVISLVSKLWNLRVLRCTSCNDVDDYCLREIANLRQLRELSLYHCCLFSAEGFIKLMKNCLGLGNLNIAGCNQLTSEFFKELFDFFDAEQKQGNSSRGPKVTTSFYHYDDYALEKYRFDRNGKMPQRLYDYLWD